MNYNLHPIFVHFPIAFFLLYSLIIIIANHHRLKKVDFTITKMALLVSGLIGAQIASSTGEIAERLVDVDRKVLWFHSGLANFSIWVYAVLLIIELIIIFKVEWLINSPLKVVTPYILKLKKIVGHSWLLNLISIIGILAISLTGLLGGVLVYGTSADPLAVPILKLLGL